MNHKVLIFCVFSVPFLCASAWADGTVHTGEFVKVPGGTFEIGCGAWQSECEETETPTKAVSVAEFEIGKHEVTQGLWKAVMGANPSRFLACGDDCPVEQVNWSSVQEFIQKLNTLGPGKYRLPTEAEWEYACRSGGKPEPYCGGTDPDKVAWYKGSSSSTTHPVGKKSPNGLGIHDMSGNVWEWTCSSHGAYDGSDKAYAACSPQGSSGVFRGGSWNHYEEDLRSTVRRDGAPEISFSFRGFRLVKVSE